MKKFLVFVLLLPAIAWAQSTTLTATGITDKDGMLWINATFQITFVPSPAWPSPNSYVWSGGNLQQNLQFSGPMGATSTFSQLVPSSNAITPSGSMWKITICPLATSGCINITAPALGATTDVTGQLNNVAVGPRFTCPVACYGYNTVEVSPAPKPGAIFWDTTGGGQFTWDGFNWVAAASGNCIGTAPNAILKSPGSAGGCAASTLTDNGTVVHGTVPIASGQTAIIGDGYNAINAKAAGFGAKGDLRVTYTGDCNTTAGTTPLICTNAHFAATDVGKAIYVAGAGNATGTLTLATIIAAYVSPTQITLGTNALFAATNTTIAWGHDDTAALQAAYNAMLAQPNTAALYIPPGNYLHHGLNWTGNTQRIYGDAYGGTNLYAIDVTDPGATSPNPTMTGVDISGSSLNQISMLNFFGGFPGAQDTAPTANVIGGRAATATQGGPLFAIAHVLDYDAFYTYGPYNFVLYGYEQMDFLNDVFQSTGTTSNGTVYITANNTPGFVSPYTTWLPPQVSTTKINFAGGRSVIATYIGPAVVLDAGSPDFPIYNVSIRDVFSNIGFLGQSTFLTDTPGGTPLRHINLDTVNIETNTCQNCKAVDLHAAAWNWRINNVQFYGPPTGYTVSQYNFAAGFLDSELMIDSSGVFNSLPQLNASSCQGSVLHLGQEYPTTNCQDYQQATGVNAFFPSPPIREYNLNSTGSTTAWWKLGTFVGNPSGFFPAGPVITINNGQGNNSLAGQQSHTIIYARLGNGSVAPNLSGITALGFGSNGAVSGIKAVATGGSTSINNASWDIYIQLAAFNWGGYSVELPVGTQWINIDTQQPDPGPASSTVVVGFLWNILDGSGNLLIPGGINVTNTLFNGTTGLTYTQFVGFLGSGPPTTPACVSTTPITATWAVSNTGQLWVCSTVTGTLAWSQVAGPTTGIVATVNRTGLTGDIGQTVMYNVPSSAAGRYRLTCYEVLTTPATTSSTTPGCWFFFNDQDTGVAAVSDGDSSIVLAGVSTSNTLAQTNLAGPTFNSNSVTVNVQAGSSISYGTSGYLTSGATSMQYALHLTVEYLGP